MYHVGNRDSEKLTPAATKTTKKKELIEFAGQQLLGNSSVFLNPEYKSDFNDEDELLELLGKLQNAPVK
jgi:hypothetical protein